MDYHIVQIIMLAIVINVHVPCLLVVHQTVRVNGNELGMNISELVILV